MELLKFGSVYIFLFQVNKLKKTFIRIFNKTNLLLAYPYQLNIPLKSISDPLVLISTHILAVQKILFCPLYVTWVFRSIE